jgi:hypothetical protein
LRKQQQQRKTIPQNIGLHKKNNGILVHWGSNQNRTDQNLLLQKEIGFLGLQNADRNIPEVNDEELTWRSKKKKLTNS